MSDFFEERREAEADVFIYDTPCIWADRIDDARLEALVCELLCRERGVHRVRQVAATRKADDARDLVVDWSVPPDRAGTVQRAQGRRQVRLGIRVVWCNRYAQRPERLPDAPPHDGSSAPRETCAG